ncbi:ribosome maturation factor RimP [Actinomarinicola tropica]|uniref:Ribosome maturation factor RimP n=1 Tax=Actinomarinicola tropica TaxID=2789776 RepID=A0A5Q2RJX9_9ACTN|nr:ribosome maturation factor RimP [Actinomarinicola tropica]QGG94871.1 ribosome maturation factor RimP [Actinomarinicola tropica]
MTTTDRIRALAEPIIVGRGFTVYDVEQQGPVLRITVAAGDAEPPSIDDLSEITRSVSHLLDDEDPIPGGYTLEVSSPGLERNLRTPAHFEGAVGELVSIKVRRTDAEGARRLRGVLRTAGDDHVLVDVEGPEGPTPTEVRHADIDKARTVFEWGPNTKPGGRPASAPARSRRSTS